MSDHPMETGARLTRQQISAAVSGLGWRLAVGVIRTSVLVQSLAQAADVARVAAGVAGPGASQSLAADLRPDRVVLTLQSRADGWIGPREVEAGPADLRRHDRPGAGHRARGGPESSGPGRRDRGPVGPGAGDRDRRPRHPGHPPVLEGRALHRLRPGRRHLLRVVLLRAT